MVVPPVEAASKESARAFSPSRLTAKKDARPSMPCANADGTSETPEAGG